MQTYETCTIVEDAGQVHLAGLPFAPGTQVDVSISPKRPSQEPIPVADDRALVAVRARMRELFRTVKGFRTSPKIPREDLYERGSLR